MGRKGVNAWQSCRLDWRNLTPELREDWDRVGLICVDRQDPVTKILLGVAPAS
ncbi:hypothetical protein [Mobiluncus mulieris]|uniref:hypothetical protein n=1 Tax=Mobiluncus mulieris TaxID=2052 RepID=UPI002016A067|nr:hypothetical protein [Mobiluncus mulieris]